jgi:hypothetical protein
MSYQIVGDIEDDGDRRGRGPGRLRRQRTAGGDDNCHSTENQLRCQRRQSIVLIVGPTVLDRDVFALDIASILEALAQRAHRLRIRFGRLRVQESDHRHRRLLRACRERPSRRAAEKCDEVASFQLIELHLVPRQPGPVCRITN